MLRFESVDAFVDALGDQTRWRRAARAMGRADRVPLGVTLSSGDSLTYRLTDQPDSVELTGHRRYLELRHAVRGHTVVEVAEASRLKPVEAYDDLSDRQRFSGHGMRFTLLAGDILVAEPGEAVRDLLVEGSVMVLRVTVEEPLAAGTQSA